MIKRVLFVVTLTSSLAAADWPEYRGPRRNSIVENSPPLVTTWPADGPKKVWTSEAKVIGDKAGGFGSVVVADGRLFVFSSPKRREAITTRTIVEAGLTQLGWTAKKPPADLLDAVERARVSDERAALKDNKAAVPWIAAWNKEHLTDEATRKACGAWVNDRLLRGKAALDLALLDKLAELKDRPFASVAAMDKWLDDNGVTGEVRKQVASKFPTTRELGDDVIYCMDITNGKTLWKQTYPSIAVENGASSTPCVSNGKVYVIGADSAVYCLDAKTGDKIWQGKVGKGPKQTSFLVADGMAIIPAGPLTAFDAATGEVRWTCDKIKAVASSPAAWTKDGKTYVVVRDNTKVLCLDAKTGQVAWQLGDTVGDATPDIVGDLMAVRVAGSGVVTLYELASDKPRKLWSVTCGMDYAAPSPIYDGHVYALGANGWVCINIKTGQITSQDKKLFMGAYASPVIADGKIIGQGSDGYYGDGSLVMITASPDKPQVLARTKVKMVLCTTPALVDGRLYCRLVDSVACYDLRKQ